MTGLAAFLTAAAVLSAAGCQPARRVRWPLADGRRDRLTAARRGSTRPGALTRVPRIVVAIVDHAGLSADPADAWRIGRAAAVLAITAGALAAGMAGAVIATGACLVAPPVLLRVLRARRARRRDALLPHWLERVASALRAGESPGGAIAGTCITTPWPLGAEVGLVVEEVAHGAALSEALDRWRSRPGTSSAVDLAASALALGLTTGGEVARAVDQVAATLRDRLEAAAEVRALATQARASAWVLGAAPIGFTVLIAAIEPRVPELLLGTPGGLACLGAGLALQGAGAAWMARITRSAT